MMKPLLRVLALAAVFLGFFTVRAHADELADARTFISAQVERIKKADLAGVKAGLTKRLQDKVTDAQVKKAGEEVGKMTIDDLVASVAPGKDSLKIKMKNGRTLTTLVKVDGAWLADTIWFK